MNQQKEHKYEENTSKICSKTLSKLTIKNNKWQKNPPIPTKTKNIIEFYTKNNKGDLLIDEKQDEFLKGELTPQNIPHGSRVRTLPNGKTLARGAFNLFAKDITLNQDKQKLWDVSYTNTSGSKTYLYSEDKVELEREEKSKLVDLFAKNYNKIIKKLTQDIKTKKTTKHLALYLLIKTKIRVGNLEHYNHLGHKGLTTLQKQNISINKKTNKINFKYIGKDAIPQDKTYQFEDFVINQLENLLKNKKSSNFVFTDQNSHPLKAHIFSDILFEYTKIHFYPHIIRSYFADNECQKYIKEFEKKQDKITKKQINKKFDKIAIELGHKKFNKKENKWCPAHTVTIKNYIRPQYSQKLLSFYKR